MTTTKQNNFEGGAAAGGEGTGITTGNSGGGSGDAFAVVTLPTAGTSYSFKFSATGCDPAGSFGGRWQLSGVTTGGWRAYLSWTPDSTQVASRLAFCFNTLPTVNVVFAVIVNAAAAPAAYVTYITATQKLQLYNASGSQAGASSPVITAGTVYGLEMQVDCGTAATAPYDGVINAQLYALSAPGTQLWSSPNTAVNAGHGSQPARLSMGESDVVANLDLTFDDLLFTSGAMTPVGPPSVSAAPAATLYAAGTTGFPAVTVTGGSTSGPNYGGSAADLGGGTGSWVNPGNATGTNDDTYATWTVP